MTRVFEYLRHHAIATIALACSLLALAGASYAALEPPNHSITPVKLDSHTIGGYVSAFAIVSPEGHVLGSSSGVQASVVPRHPGVYFIDWHVHPHPPCSVIGSFSGAYPGYLSGGVAGPGSRSAEGEQSIVHTYGINGQHAEHQFAVELLCWTPR